MMIRQRLAPGEVILGVDPKIDGIFDIDDATKVRRIGDRIVDIGKDIQEYDAHRYWYVPVYSRTLRRTRRGQQGRELFAVGRHAPAGKPRTPARLRDR